MDKIQKISEYIKECNKIVFFGGAGVSTESGVPDFRSKDGLYNQHDVQFENYRPEYLLSHSCLIREPEVFFEFYRQKIDARTVKPNAAHLFLAELEKRKKLLGIVTQNIDGLHQKAGSRKVFEIHGSSLENYCMRCGKKYDENFIYDSKERIPHCTCGGKVRPKVTLYEESLPQYAVNSAILAIASCDMLIIGGTSLTVYPAASFINYYRGKHLVVINRDPLQIPLNPEKDLEINEPIGKVFSEVWKNLD